MSIGSISGLSTNYLQSILDIAKNSASGTSSTNNSTSSIGSSSIPSDNSQLSPFAQMMSTLQQLQQSNPTEYKQVTQQISTNLQNAAQTATAEGNTTAATQLNQLATDFSSASQSGQLPNIQDLAQAVGSSGHGHHHHHHASSSTDSDSSSSTDSTSNSTGNQLISQLFASQTNSSSTQSNSLNPMSIIFDTLSSAGISSGSNS
jgi:hypothetical protein